MRELKTKHVFDVYEAYAKTGDDDAAQVYLKAEVDATIAELKAKLESVQATAYAESVDAGMENRKLKRALYKALANWALSTLAWLDCIDQGNPAKWSEMHRKCLTKAEEYK